MPKQKKNLPKFEVSVTDTAKSDLQGIEAKERLQVLQKIQGLETSPFPSGKRIRKIKASRKIPLFRLRAGDYRVIFHIRNKVVYVFQVIHRKDFEKALKSLIKSIEERIANM